jgi:hypothetical protein
VAKKAHFRFPAFPHQIAFELKKISPKPPFLFISDFSTAAYNYFNYFGPWTADVQGPPLNSCVMNVIMTALKDRPVKKPARAPRDASVLACGLRRRPAATRHPGTKCQPATGRIISPCPDASPEPKAQNLLRGANFKFLELFCPPPGPAPSNLSKSLKSNDLTN